MLIAIQRIAERKIEEAMEEGRFAGLGHWKNRPLPEDDMQHVPPSLRMAYRVLKNGGYVPEEVSLKKEIATVEEMLARCTDERQRYNQLKKLNFLKFKLEARMGRSLHIDSNPTYHRKVVERLSVKG